VLGGHRYGLLDRVVLDPDGPGVKSFGGSEEIVGHGRLSRVFGEHENCI
jgi:hypothetical protein